MIPSFITFMRSDLLSGRYTSLSNYLRYSGAASLPGVVISYTISAMEVRFVERRGASVERTIARVCALVGGVFAVRAIMNEDGECDDSNPILILLVQ